MNLGLAVVFAAVFPFLDAEVFLAPALFEVEVVLAPVVLVTLAAAVLFEEEFVLAPAVAVVDAFVPETAAVPTIAV